MSQSTSPKPQWYNTAAIRELLTAALSDEELTTLCYDYFRPVHDRFSAGQSRSAKTQLLIEYCERHGEFPRLLTEVNRINPRQYQQFIAQQAHGAIGLHREEIPAVDTRPQAVQEEYQRLAPSEPPTTPPALAAFEDFQFYDQTRLCQQILQSNANHIELYGPGGVGKTYILRHIANRRQDTLAPYLDLREFKTVEAVRQETIRQLWDGAASPPTAADAMALARALHARYHDPQTPVRHVLFALDAATEGHKKLIDWLISVDGLINEPLRNALDVIGIGDDLKLQVVIASRRPIVKASSYHPYFHFERIPVDRLRKEPDPAKDPIQCMLRELATYLHVPIAPGPCQRIADRVYDLTGGHPGCAKLLLLAIADRGFVIRQESEWRRLFKTYVLPTIQREMLGSLADIDLIPVFWVLSVFGGFDQRLLGELLQRQLLPGPSLTDRREVQRYARKLRRRLMDTYLVHEPTVGKSMYSINHPVSRVLALSMQYLSPDRYRAITGAALEIFTDWLQSAEISAERSITSLIQIVYHWFKALEMEKAAGAISSKKEICGRISSALDTYLSVLLTTINEVDWPSYFPQLRDHWHQAEKLREAALRATGNRRCYEKLTHQVDDFVQNYL